MFPTKGYATHAASEPLEPFSFERREPTPTDVQLEILFCGVCHSDIHMARNEWGGGTTYPCVPGPEIVGRVVKAGRNLKNPKGNPLEVARIAGIAAAKRTAEWIPLCHPLPLTHIDVTPRLCKDGVEIHSKVTATAQTGVEMEALVAVSAAALTVYDMCKALDKSMEITDIVLVEKIGGKSGHYLRRGGK